MLGPCPRTLRSPPLHACLPSAGRDRACGSHAGAPTTPSWPVCAPATSGPSSSSSTAITAACSPSAGACSPARGGRGRPPAHLHGRLSRAAQQRPADPPQGLALHHRAQPLPVDPARPPRAGGFDDGHAASDGLAADIDRRAELRGLLADLEQLPEEQRAALVLFELGDHSHDEIAEVLGVRRDKVKALVFQARESLAGWRQARETPCTRSASSSRRLAARRFKRAALRRHVARCEGCAEFETEVRRQRSAMALLLPAVPTAGLKAAVLGAAGIGAGAGAAAAGARWPGSPAPRRAWRPRPCCAPRWPGAPGARATSRYARCRCTTHAGTCPPPRRTAHRAHASATRGARTPPACRRHNPAAAPSPPPRPRPRRSHRMRRAAIAGGTAAATIGTTDSPATGRAERQGMAPRTARGLATARRAAGATASATASGDVAMPGAATPRAARASASAAPPRPRLRQPHRPPPETPPKVTASAGDSADRRGSANRGGSVKRGGSADRAHSKRGD